MNKDDKAELIGQIIDIFEDELEERTLGNHNKYDTWKAIPLCFSDEESDGVFYGGNYYDKVAIKIEETLKSWGLLN